MTRLAVSSQDNFDWGRFFGLYRPAAVRFARGLTGSEESAEDVVQEAAGSVFARARAGELSLASQEHARNYFFRAVHNLAVSDLRQEGRNPARPLEGGEADRSPRPDELAAREDTRAAADRRRRQLQLVIATLREPERAVLRLRYAENLTFREIAERTGAAISTLQARVESALVKIRKRLGKTPWEA